MPLPASSAGGGKGEAGQGDSEETGGRGMEGGSQSGMQPPARPDRKRALCQEALSSFVGTAVSGAVGAETVLGDDGGFVALMRSDLGDQRRRVQ